MTPYEIADLSQTSFSNAMSCYALIISLVSGYLIITYLVGSKLTRFQITLLTSIFLFAMGFLTWSMAAYAYWGNFYAAQGISEAALANLFRTTDWTVGAVVMLNLITITMCLLFMWNIRSSKG